MKRLLPVASILVLTACAPAPHAPSQTGVSSAISSAGTTSVAAENSASSAALAVTIFGKKLPATSVDTRWQEFTNKRMGFKIVYPKYTWSEETKTRTPVTATAFGDRIAVHTGAFSEPQSLDEPSIEYSQNYSYNFWVTITSAHADLEKFVARVTAGKCVIPAQPDNTTDGIETYYLKDNPTAKNDDFMTCSRVIKRKPSSGTTIYSFTPKLGGGWAFYFETDGGGTPFAAFL